MTDRGAAAAARYVHSIRRSSVPRSLTLTEEVRLDDRKFGAFCRSGGYHPLRRHLPPAATVSACRNRRNGAHFLCDRRPSGECRLIAVAHPKGFEPLASAFGGRPSFGCLGAVRHITDFTRLCSLDFATDPCSLGNSAQVRTHATSKRRRHQRLRTQPAIQGYML
jgi:hypothetical protein